MLPFVKLRFLSKTRFLSHNFGSRYGSQSIKGCKDADHSLVSINFEPKNRLIGLAPRAW